MNPKEFKSLKKHLLVKLSEPYPYHFLKTRQEIDGKIKIEEKGHQGDITRYIYYTNGKTDSFIGYISFLPERRDPKKELPYAVSIVDGEGITYHKTPKTAAKTFVMKSESRIEEIVSEMGRNTNSQKNNYPFQIRPDNL